MDLLQLKYFQTVAKFEHMTKAAHELQIAQPALSVTIARLEEDLGVPLFNRIGRNIVLNEYGKALLKRTDRALIELEEGRQEIADMAGSEAGYVSVTSTSLNKQFCDFLGVFVKLYPKVNFHLTQIADDATKLNLLETGEVDFCFINETGKRPGIVCVPLMEEEIFLAVPPGYHLANRTTISVRELAEEPFVSLKAEHSLRKFCDHMCLQNGFMPNIVCECSESQAIVNLVGAGLGITFFPSSSIERPDLPIRLVKIEDFDCQSVLRLAWKEKRYFSKAAVQFREYVCKYFGAKK
jgi:DNA-binding transcriptional LysR family regulator